MQILTSGSYLRFLPKAPNPFNSAVFNIWLVDPLSEVRGYEINPNKKIGGENKKMKTICKSLLIASLAVVVIVVSAGAADISYGEDERYTNVTQGTSVVVNPDPVVGDPNPDPIPEFSTIAIPVASVLGLLFLFSYRRHRRE